MHRAYSRQSDSGNPIHNECKCLRKVYGTVIEIEKKCHWEGFLMTVDKKMVWTAHHYMSVNPADRGKACMPTLRVQQHNSTKMSVESNEDKSSALCNTFLKPGQVVQNLDAEEGYPPPKFSLALITDKHIWHAIS